MVNSIKIVAMPKEPVTCSLGVEVLLIYAVLVFFGG